MESGQRNTHDFFREIKNGSLLFALIGGVFLAANGSDGLHSGIDRFNREVAGCEMIITQTNPLVYSLKTQTDVCTRLGQGVPATQLIAEFDAQAERDRPFGLAEVIIGGTAAGGAIVIGLGPMILNYRRRGQVVEELSEPPYKF